MSHQNTYGNEKSQYAQYDRKRKDSNYQGNKGARYIKKQQPAPQAQVEVPPPEEQKAAQLEGWLFNQIGQQDPSQRGPRRSLTKEKLLSRFKPLSQIDFALYGQKVLEWAEIFCDPQAPESLNPKLPPMAQVQNNVVNKPQFRGGPQRHRMDRRPYEPAEEEEDDMEPEWIDFDPKKEAVKNFFGRAIPNEGELRSQAKQNREIGEQRARRQGKLDDDDEFEKMIEEEESKKREQEQQKNADLERKAEMVASEIEKSKTTYSDIDVIVEKKVRANGQAKGMNDEEVSELFGSLKKQGKGAQPAPKEEKKELLQLDSKDLAKQLEQQIEFLSQQQKAKLRQQKLVQEQKPQFTALQNLERLFQPFTVVTHEKHRIKLDAIQRDHSLGKELFSNLMSSINPFSKFILQELEEEEETKEGGDRAYWQLEESIQSLLRQGSQTQQKEEGEQVNVEKLKKTSAQMFKIYKFCSNPYIRLKSEKYTSGQYVYIKDLFPMNNLLWTSPLNYQLQNQPLSYQMPSAYPQYAQTQFAMPSQPASQQPQYPPGMPPQQPLAQPSAAAMPSLQPSAQAPSPAVFPQLLAQANQLASKAAEEEEYGEEEEYQQHDLSDMEQQLKSIIGFNLK